MPPQSGGTTRGLQLFLQKQQCSEHIADCGVGGLAGVLPNGCPRGIGRGLLDEMSATAFPRVRDAQEPYQRALHGGRALYVLNLTPLAPGALAVRQPRSPIHIRYIYTISPVDLYAIFNTKD